MLENQHHRPNPQQLITRVFGKGKCYIPSPVRRRLLLKDGDILIWELTASGEVKVSKAKILRD
ncbi:MAG: hypothetical protein ACUVTM_06440 [Candidatus Bathyarchaeia archaeon]